MKLTKKQIAEIENKKVSEVEDELWEEYLMYLISPWNYFNQPSN